MTLADKCNIAQGIVKGLRARGLDYYTRRDILTLAVNMAYVDLDAQDTRDPELRKSMSDDENQFPV